MTDQTKEENWTELRNVINECTWCRNNGKCNIMKDYLKGCKQARYRFRCPIEVFDERTEE